MSKDCHVELLSQEECTQIVRRHLNLDNINVIDHKLQYASKKIVGFLGEYLYLTITIKDVNSGSSQPKEYLYFVKSLPTRSQTQREMLIETGIFKREVVIYEKLFSEFNKFCKAKWHPDCYFSRPDILVLEELTALGYEQITDRKTFTSDEVKSVLRNLVAMHAESIIYETKYSENIGKKYKDTLREVSFRKDIGWFNASLLSLKAVAEIHPKYQTKEYQEFLSQKFLKKIEPVFELVRPSKKFRNVLCHGDIWHNNVFFKHNRVNKSVNSLLIDFQICRYAPPAIDVLNTIYVNSVKSEREQNYDEYIKYYHIYLANELKSEDINIDDCLPLQEFLESCDYAKLLALVYYSMASTILYLPKHLLHQLKYDDPEKYDYYMNVNRNELILENIQLSENYKNKLFTAVEELVDYVYQR